MYVCGASQVAQWVNKSTSNAGDARDVGLIPRLERLPVEGNGNLFQYSCLKNPMDRGAWQATVRGVTKSWTLLKQLSMYTHVCMYVPIETTAALSIHLLMDI